jgi:Bacterial PH domain/Short C-terminal domain
MSETTTTNTDERSPPDLTAQYASLLASGERVLLVRQRHWMVFVDAARWFVGAVVAGIVLAALGQSVPEDGITGFLHTLLTWGFWLFVVVGLAGVAWFYYAWRVERYIVTTRRVIEAGGIVNKYTRDTTLSMITDMLVNHPWLGRIVGYGEIDLLTASEQGTSRIRFLPDADAFKRELLDAKHEYEMEVGGGHALEDAVAAATARSAAAPPAQAQPLQPAATPPAQPQPAASAPQRSQEPLTAEEVDASLTRLADMRDRGLITQPEFEAKKKELLDRL